MICFVVDGIVKRITSVTLDPVVQEAFDEVLPDLEAAVRAVPDAWRFPKPPMRGVGRAAKSPR